MATRSWLSTAADGDWGNTANWSGGAVPTTGDHAIIDAGSVNIDDGLTDAASDELASLTIGPNYTGQVGLSNTAPLTFNCTGKVVVNGGGNNQYLSVGDATWATCMITSPGSTGNGNVTVMGAITTLIVERGTVLVYSGTTTTAFLMPAGGSSSAAKLRLQTGTITTLHKGAAFFEAIDAKAGTVTTLNLLSGNAVIGTAQTVTTANIYGGALYFYPTTTMTLCNAIGGIFYAASMASQTITTLTISPGGAAFINQGAIADTVGTTNKFGGGLIEVPSSAVPTSPPTG